MLLAGPRPCKQPAKAGKEILGISDPNFLAETATLLATSSNGEGSWEQMTVKDADVDVPTWNKLLKIYQASLIVVHDHKECPNILHQGPPKAGIGTTDSAF